MPEHRRVKSGINRLKRNNDKAIIESVAGPSQAIQNRIIIISLRTSLSVSLSFMWILYAPPSSHETFEEICRWHDTQNDILLVQRDWNAKVDNNTILLW